MGNQLRGVPLSELWTFNNSTLTITVANYSRESNEIKLKGNKLTTLNHAYSGIAFKSISNDSIVVISQNNKFSQIFKRLDDSLKNTLRNIQLVGKSFVRNYKKWTNIIHFANDYEFVSSSWTKSKHYNSGWERIRHDGFDMLFTDLYPLFIIQEKKGNDIYICTFGKEKEDYIVKELE
jgi:hypothetical protein